MPDVVIYHFLQRESGGDINANLVYIPSKGAFIDHVNEGSIRFDFKPDSNSGLSDFSQHFAD